MKKPEEAKDVQRDLELVHDRFDQIKTFLVALLENTAASKSVQLSAKDEKTAAQNIAKEFENAGQAILRARSRMGNLATTLEEREASLNKAESQVEKTIEDDVSILATSTSGFVTRHGFYATMDFGVASAWNIDEVVSYIGMNFYTRPINKEAHLRHGEKDWFRKRFSVTLGLTVQTLTKAGAYKGVLSDRALVGAVGWRVLDSVKLTAG